MSQTHPEKLKPVQPAPVDRLKLEIVALKREGVHSSMSGGATVGCASMYCGTLGCFSEED